MTLAAQQASSAPMPLHAVTVTIPQKPLRDALNRVTRIIPNRDANPGLTLAQIEIEPGRLTIKGTSIEASIQVSLEAEATGAATLAVFAAPLQQIINNAPGEDITLKADGKELQIASGTYKTRLQLVEANSAPQITFPTGLPGTTTAETLTKLLDSTRFAAAVADFQAVFRGVLLEFSQTRTRAVATDGYRLAYYDAPATPGLDTTILVPSKLTYEITRAFTEGNVRIGVSDKRLALENDTTKLTVSLMDGQFPDYERVIPTLFQARITLDAKELAETLARVSLMSDRSANSRVDLHLRNGQLTVTTEGSYGSAHEQLQVEQAGEAEEIMLAVNSKYLTDGISPISGKLTLNLTGNQTPLTIVNHEDEGYLGMLVPLRTT